MTQLGIIRMKTRHSPWEYKTRRQPLWGMNISTGRQYQAWSQIELDTVIRILAAGRSVSLR
jgi:hypothetical protein